MVGQRCLPRRARLCPDVDDLPWRIDGRKNATVFAATGFFWLASFAAHYYLALRFTLENDRLRETWSLRCPLSGRAFSILLDG